MKKYLVTASTENYYNIIFPYLRTIQINSNFDQNILITLDFKKSSIDKIDYVYLSNELVVNKNENNCLQHGEFLKSNFFKELKEEDIICFTDGDILLQRKLSEEEINLLDNIVDDEVYLQYNAGNTDTLAAEFYRLSPLEDLDKVKNILNINFSNMPCYNTGVLICNKKTWLKLENYYSIFFNKIKKCFGHYAKQQWILSLIINLFFKPKLLNYSFHCHYHHGRVDKSYFNNNVCFYNGEIVLFSHLCMDNDLSINKNGFLIQQKRFLGEF